MLMRRPLPRKKVARAVSACAAALLALVLLVDVAQAHRTYIYCAAMQQVMTHACCKQHRASAFVPALTARGPDCCQGRVVPSLGAWTASDRSSVPSAPPLFATISHRPFEALAMAEPPIDVQRPSIRSGPPISRALAKLMVLRL
jgi:hypothetical protein